MSSEQPATHTITILDTGESFPCREDQHLLKGMERIGRKGIPVGCRGGGCGICKVQVVRGRYRTRKMSREHISPQDEAAGVVLACRVYPDSDLAVELIGLIRKNVMRGLPQAANG